MRVKEFIKNIMALSFNESRIQVEIEKKYGTKLQGEIRKLVNALGKDSVFFEEEDFVRLLSKDEVLNAENEFSTNFREYSLIPMFDSGNNDFICYNYDEKDWCMFNIVENTPFNFMPSIYDYFS